jgi:hypothetical protein
MGKARWQFVKNTLAALLVLGALAILSGGSARIAGVIIIAVVVVSYIAVRAKGES